jgi:hypothetical protein
MFFVMGWGRESRLKAVNVNRTIAPDHRAVTGRSRPVARVAGVRSVHSAKEAGDVLRMELDAGDHLFEAR